jgi:uncharacterized membrane protein YqjE
VTATSGSTGLTGSTNGDEPSIGDLVKEATTQFSTVLRGEVELAKLELKSSVKNLGTGAVGFVIAAVLAIFGLTFLFIGLAELLAWAGLFRWVAYLIVFAFIFLVAGASGFLGFRKVKKVRAPERTIATTKSTVEALRHPSQHQ